MFLHRWLNQLAQRWSLRGGKRRRHAGRAPSSMRRRVRPRLEILEERLTPSFDLLSFSVGGSQFSSSTIAPNQASGAISVQLQDSSGHAMTAASDLTVKLSSSSSTAAFLDLAGKPLANNSIVISAGSNFALFEYEDSQTGNATIAGQSSNHSAFGGLNVNVQDRLAFTTAPQTLTPGQKSPPITIQLQDGTGAPVNATSALTFSLSGNATGKFFDASGNPLPTNSFNGVSITIAAGSNSASFEYEDSQAGSAFLSAFSSSGVSASQQLSIQYSLAFTTPVQVIPTNKASGAITVQLQDNQGNPITATSAVNLNVGSFTGTSKFFDTSGNPLPTNSFGGNILTVAAGANSASFEYEDSQALVATVTVSNSSGPGSVQQQVYVGQPLVITTPVQTIATGKPSQPITIQLGSAAASDTTINLSSTSTTGQFLDTSGRVLANSSITIAAGSSKASFEYQDSQTGLPTLSAATSDFSAFAQQQENIGLSLSFTTSPQTVAAGQLSQPMTVQLQDSKGQPFAPTTDTFLQLSSTNFGQFFDTTGSALFGLTIKAGTSSASFEYKSQSLTGGTDTINVTLTSSGSSGTLLSASQQVTLTPPPFNEVTIVSPAQTIAAGKASQPITVQLRNNGAAFTATSDVTINLSSSSSTGKFLDTSGKVLANNSIIIAAGASTASFEYQDSQEWFPLLSVQVNGIFTEGNQTENIGGLALTFTTPPQTITAGQPSGTMTLQFTDSSGNAVKTPIDSTISLSSTSRTGVFLDTTGKTLPSPNGFGYNLDFASGATSVSFEYKDSIGGKPTLTAQDSSVGLFTQGNAAQVLQQQTVTGPFAVQFTTTGQVLTPNQPSQPISIQLVDSTGQPVTTTSAVTVSLSSTSSGGKFLDTAGNVLANASITIAAGTGSASFEYEDSQSGLPMLTVTENGLTTQLQENVGISAVFTTAAQSLSAGQTSQPLTIKLQDGNGNAFNAPSDLAFTLTSLIQGVQFLDTAGNALTNGTITISKDTNSASFEFKSKWGGSPTLIASYGTSSSGLAQGLPGALLSATQTETVAGLSALAFTTSPQTLTAGQTSQLVTVQLEDNTGKAAPAPSGGLALTLSLSTAVFNSFGTSGAAQFFDAKGNPLPLDQFGSTSITIPEGSKTVSFTYQAARAGTFVLNALVPNGFSMSQQATIQTGAPSSVVFITPAQSLLAGTPSGSITVELQDQFGNVIPAGSGGLTFTLSSSSSGGQFLSMSGDPLANSSITIPQGASSATFEYVDSKSGTPTLTVKASGVSGTVQLPVASTSSEIHVTNTKDSGVGSLRNAIIAANNTPGSTIVFDTGVTGTIDLLSELPNITTNTNILGPGADKLTIERSSSASAAFGGFNVGIPLSFFLSSEPVVTISGLTVANFTGTGITNSGSLTVRQVDVSNNQAPSASSATTLFGAPGFGPPGGIMNGGNSLTVLDSTIANNSTTNNLVAAGIDSESGAVIILNSTIVGNVDNNSNSAGGVGIYGGSAYIASSTISGNTATQATGFFGSNTSGGGLDAFGQVTLYDTIVAGNTGSKNNPTDVSGTLLSLGNNLIGKADSHSKGFVSSDQVGTTASPIDPKLGGLANNGGPTPTMALLTGSPALAAGSSVNAPANDQRGEARPQGAIDIGAFELTTTSNSVAPSVTGNPSNQTATAGADVSFTASATGTPTPTVQWQVSSDGGKTFINISGATSTTLTLSAVTTALNGNKYQAVFTNSAGSAPSTAATLTVNAAVTAPKVTGDPSNQSAVVGDNVSFSASATGNPTPTVQWQVSTDGGTTFTNISGATGTTLTLSSVTLALNGNEYHAVFTNSAGSATSTAATLTVTETAVVPSVTGSPKDQTVTAGKSVSFTASASGSPTPTVKWQVSIDGGTTFTDISGATSTTLTLNNVTADMNGNKFQAVFTNSAGSATSTAATLTVQFAPTVTTDPTGQTVAVGQNASFSAAANGNPTPTVQWQVSTDGGKTFTNISGATNTTLAVNNVVATQNGAEYRAVFTNSVGTVNSAAATLSVQFAPTVTANPSNQTVTQSLSATFTATANGNPAPTVKWQVSTDGGTTFTDISGATNTTLTVNNVTKAMNGNKYHAVFTNSIGSITSTAATLTVTAAVAPVITGNPSARTVTAGQSATFTASASGAPTPTVQWQISIDGGKTFTNINGATSTTLTLLNVTTAMNGNQFHAVFTNVGGSVTSAAVKLTVNAPPPPPPTPPAPPALHTPPLLGLFNSLFGGVETINADGSVTVTASFFGIPLFVSTFDSHGNLRSVDLFGFDITFLFLLL